MPIHNNVLSNYGTSLQYTNCIALKKKILMQQVELSSGYILSEKNQCRK